MTTLVQKCADYLTWKVWFRFYTESLEAIKAGHHPQKPIPIFREKTPAVANLSSDDATIFARITSRIRKILDRRNYEDYQSLYQLWYNKQQLFDIRNMSDVVTRKRELQDLSEELQIILIKK